MLNYYGPDSGLIDTQVQAREESGLISEKYCACIIKLKLLQKLAGTCKILVPTFNSSHQWMDTRLKAALDLSLLFQKTSGCISGLE